MSAAVPPGEAVAVAPSACLVATTAPAALHSSSEDCAGSSLRVRR
eukprot:CAMPEP_0114274346 /NCGR_PEP_ID=MMETSP0058-20121206/29691_1 /TAXON_ID=36894 /ORGANISM="Pyramimonas parkeae, CCMP726" /LENGTH=44 /DNA_ID= /DNA_START= /DNA_END= /DNA_ORIENTATION=